jgi:hypothetical protein
MKNLESQLSVYAHAVKEMHPHTQLSVRLIEDDHETNYLISIVTDSGSDSILLTQPEWDNFENLFYKRGIIKINSAVARLQSSQYLN